MVEVSIPVGPQPESIAPLATAQDGLVAGLIVEVSVTVGPQPESTAPLAKLGLLPT